MLKSHNIVNLNYFSSLALLLVILVIVPACDFIHLNKGSKPEEPYAARAYDKYLYLSELQKKFPGNMSPEDSIFWTRNYINLWVQEQLFLHQAINNLPAEEQDFIPQLEAYKNSLLQYAYETRLIEQNLDTIILNTEIKKYYDDHQDDFILNRDIVKVFYTAIWKDSTKIIKDFKKILAKNPLSLEDMEYFYDDMVFPLFYLDTTQWLYFDDILEIIPIQTDNIEFWLKNNHTKEFLDEHYWYFIFINDYRLKDQQSPLELEWERIRKILLVRRKEVMLKDLKRSIFENAQKKGAFEIF